MTENEAKILLCQMYLPQFDEKEKQALTMAIQSLEEVQQNREFGTVEEFKTLKEKSVAKKVIRLSDNGYYDYKCPACGMPDKDCMGKRYCNCGQALET